MHLKQFLACTLGARFPPFTLYAMCIFQSFSFKLYFLQRLVECNEHLNFSTWISIHEFFVESNNNFLNGLVRFSNTISHKEFIDSVLPIFSAEGGCGGKSFFETKVSWDKGLFFVC